MSYYPKSRIIINQKTIPGQFLTETRKEYNGDYYITYEGKYFSGANPQSKNSYPLIKIEPVVNTNTKLIPNRENIIFNNLNKNNIDITELKEPQQYYPKPTEIDYQNKKITRYFAKQRVIRLFKIIEIDKDTYDDINEEKGVYNYPLWKVTSLFWQISGPLEDERPNGFVVRAGVLDTNKRIVDNKEKSFSGINQYLTNLQQFYKP